MAQCVGFSDHHIIFTEGPFVAVMLFPTARGEEDWRVEVEQPKSGQGRKFEEFVIPKDCGAFEKVSEPL